MNTVVFSKNRPMQLDALLRSLLVYNQSWTDCHVTVIYVASSPEFELGYDQVRRYWSQNVEVEFREQTDSFKQDVLDAIRSHDALTMFLVDDIIFTAPFHLSDKPNQNCLHTEQVICCSLRLWPGVNYCYPTREIVQVPECQLKNLNFTSYLFNWKGGQGDFGYPMSVDGHIFRTPFILRVLNAIQFHNPNSMEGAMAGLAGFLGQWNFMTCYKDKARLVNIPANRVQDTAPNRHGDLWTPEELNVQFLAGRAIDINPFKDLQSTAPHMELPLRLV